MTSNPVEKRSGSRRASDRESISRLNELSERLEQNVSARTHELIQKENELYQNRKMDAVGTLAGGVAHDFNNLIAGIVGLTEDLLDSLPLGDPRRNDLDAIIRASKRAFVVTKQLLAIGARQVLQPRPIDLNAVIHQVRPLFDHLLDSRVEVRLTLQEIPFVRSDHSHLEQIVLNLAMNAKDAMVEGGTLTIETGSQYLSGRLGHFAVEPGNYVTLKVGDTGCGMNDVTLARLFEPFFSTKKQSGTGLGLATVYGIVKQHCGTILVESAVGKGTLVQIYLPAMAEKENASALLSTSTQGRSLSFGFDATVLVVEDEEIVRRIVCRKLSAAGLQVIESSNGREAISASLAYTGTIDLIVTDVVMPDMNGRETVERVRSERPEILALFMSGYPEEIITRQGVLEPGIHFIEKSAISSHLLAKIEDLLHSRETPANS